MTSKVWATGALLLPCLFIACSADESSSAGGDSGSGNGGRAGRGGIAGSGGFGAKGGVDGSGATGGSAGFSGTAAVGGVGGGVGSAGLDAGFGGSGGVDGGNVDAGGSAGSPADFDALGTCGPSTCGLSNAHLLEGSSRTVVEAPARCVLVALRDRKPGLYLHLASSYWSSGPAGTEHRLLVAADGSVLYAKHTYNGAIVFQPMTHAYSPAQRCALREPAFFQACIDAVDGTTPADDAAAWTCLYGQGAPSSVPTELQWIHSCVDAKASCN